MLERERRALLTRMNSLMNRSPDDPIPLPQRFPELAPLPKAESLRDQALQSRPELKAWAARTEGFKTRTKLAQREFYPDFNLSAGYNSLWDRTEKRFTLGIGINIP